MGKTLKLVPENVEPQIMPARTDEEKLKQCISLAYDVVEERLRNKTASSQETCFFLKYGTAMAKLEEEKIKNENELALAKIEALKTASRNEELYAEALNAFSRYSGANNAIHEEL